LLVRKPVKDIAVCSIVKAELFYGAIKSANPQRNLTLQQEFLSQFISLTFDDLAAMDFGMIRSGLEALGTPELMIYKLRRSH
jgi:tRNA(fMet)-specific endonuclease VapC